MSFFGGDAVDVVRCAARLHSDQAGGQIRRHPIEMAFSKLKALLRKAAERTVEGLWDAIGRLVELITPAEITNVFAAAGDEPE